MKFNLIYILLATFASLLFSLSFYFKHVKPYVLTFYDTDFKIVKQAEGSEIPTSIAINKIELEIPIEIASISNGQWYISDNSAVYLRESALPEKPGAMIIYAHNKRGLFQNIHKLALNDEITINTTSKNLKYSIYDIKTVNPSDAWILTPQKEVELIIYTCTGVLDTKRLVIKAIPIN